MLTPEKLGAITACAIFIICILVFAARLKGKSRLEYWLGVLLLFTVMPLLILLIKPAPSANRALYSIQIGLMLLYLLTELILDYLIKSNFRKTLWLAIVYTMLFFAGTGGMIGVASLAGRDWMLAAVVLFLIMAGLAFWQHYKVERKIIHE